jgi:hypothetical protein
MANDFIRKMNQVNQQLQISESLEEIKDKMDRNKREFAIQKRARNVVEGRAVGLRDFAYKGPESPAKSKTCKI